MDSAAPPMMPTDIGFKSEESLLSVCVVETDGSNVSTPTLNTKSPVFCEECFSIVTVLMLVDRAGDCCEEMMCANAVSGMV